MDKQEKIVQMFDEIAPTYDKANHILSFGIDKTWRKKACDFLMKKYNNIKISIADVACGTGDMIEAWSVSAKKHNVNVKEIIGIDPSSKMLSIARKRFPNNEFICAFAGDIGLNDETIDIISISYGIRNVVDITQALKEFNRILKINGYVVVLEFTKRKKGGFIAKIRDLYLMNILPIVGAIISKNKAAYKYLPNSINEFLNKDDFCLELKKAGFQIEFVKSFSFDVSTLFVARKVSFCDK